jgi:hypothetical protein
MRRFCRTYRGKLGPLENHSEAIQSKDARLIMLYTNDSLMFAEVFQGWCAMLRDQAALQWIATSTAQHGVQSQWEQAVQAGTDLVEDELELPYQVALARPAPGPKSRCPAMRMTRRNHRH